MRESLFIERNKQRWNEIENYQKDNPDELASDFIDLVNDLSYAQTQYPHSKLTNYLNYLAAGEYKTIFKKKDDTRILDFWSRDFPLIIGHNKKVLWLALALFLTFTVLGYVCSFLDKNFIESVLGTGYVDMTIQNIKKGVPFGVYESKDAFSMFLMIFANNLLVGLILFISGILLGIGTFYYTFKNGIMFGSFMAMFFKYGLGLQAISIIMLHGTIELMGLILECMAGIILGLSFLFPHTLTRKESMLKGLLEGSKIYLGTMPFTIFAAFIESYITNLGKSGLQTNNILVSIFLFLVLVGSWILVIWYFFIYSKKITQTISLENYLKEIVKK